MVLFIKRVTGAVLVSAVIVSVFGQSVWTTRRSASTSTDFYAVASMTNMNVIAGKSFSLITSPDTNSWSNSGQVNSKVNVYDITKVGNKLMAAGITYGTGFDIGGTIWTSTNGTSWTSETTNYLLGFHGIASNGSTTIVVAEGGGIYSSPNGSTWKADTNFSGVDFYHVAYNGTCFAAVGTGGTIVTSSSAGVWTKRTSGTSATLYGIYAKGSKFIAVGAGGMILTSPDGVTWTVRTQVAGPNLESVYANTAISIAVGANGRIMTSTDDSIWTSTPSGVTTTLYGISANWNGAYFIAVGSAGTILTSTDGLTWTIRDYEKPRIGVTWDGSQFAITGNNPGTITTTANASVWSTKYTNGDLVFSGIIHTDTQFVAIGVIPTNNNRGFVASSTNGTSWSVQPVQSHRLNCVAWTGAQFVAAGDSGDIVTTPNTSTAFTLRSSGTTKALYGIIWTGTQLVAVGNSGTILSSTDGVTWTKRTSGTTVDLRGIAWNGSKMIATGASGTVLGSSDGITWETVSSGTTMLLGAITWAENQFVAVGNKGVVLTSPDGTTWTARTSGITNSLSGIVSSGTNIMAIAYDGTVITSPVDAAAIPGAPVLLSPVNAAVKQVTPVALTWSRVSYASTYNVQISTNGTTFSPLAINDSTVPALAKTTVGLVAATTYFWRVRAKNALGTGAWSDVWSFTMQGEPDAPVLVSPANGAVSQAITRSLSWNKTPGALSYRVQLSIDSLFSQTQLNDSTKDTARGYSYLSGLTKYYWRVYAKNAAGTSAWSAVFSFTTVLTVPSTVTLVAPVKNTKVQVSNILFSWNKAVPSVDRYVFVIDTGSSFRLRKSFFVDSAVADTFKVVPTLQDGITYYWRVNAHNSLGFGSSNTDSCLADASVGIVTPIARKVSHLEVAISGKSIRYSLPIESDVSINICNIQGKFIRTIGKSRQQIGAYQLPIDFGGLSKGCYIIDLSIGTLKNRKMVMHY